MLLRWVVGLLIPTVVGLLIPTVVGLLIAPFRKNITLSSLRVEKPYSYTSAS